MNVFGLPEMPSWLYSCKRMLLCILSYVCSTSVWPALCLLWCVNPPTLLISWLMWCLQLWVICGCTQ